MTRSSTRGEGVSGHQVRALQGGAVVRSAAARGACGERVHLEGRGDGETGGGVAIEDVHELLLLDRNIKVERMQAEIAALQLSRDAAVAACDAACHEADFHFASRMVGESDVAALKTYFEPAPQEPDEWVARPDSSCLRSVMPSVLCARCAGAEVRELRAQVGSLQVQLAWLLYRPGWFTRRFRRP